MSAGKRANEDTTMSVMNKTIAVLAIAGGAEHILAKVLNFSLVGKIVGWLSFIPGVEMIVYLAAGAAGVYVGVKYFK